MTDSDPIRRAENVELVESNRMEYFEGEAGDLNLQIKKGSMEEL